MKPAIYVLALVGSYFVWRNRFAIQHQLESVGIKTPTLKGGLAESAQSMASKVTGKIEHGIDYADDHMNQEFGNL